MFFAHLTIECLLKSLVVLKTKNQAPYTHNLVILADKAGLKINNKQLETLKTTTTFNITNRYPDDKFIFYKSIDKKYCGEWIKNINQLRLWLIKKYPTKK
ncbi:MAG: HEPN domain-containing protein [Patescibacteria group bacterium]